MDTRLRAVRWACVALAALGAPGCVYATKVTRPGGREAFRIHCSSPSQCADKAAEVCSGAYETLSTSTEMDGYVDNGTGYAGSPHELVVACRTTPPALDGGGPVAPPPPTLPAPPAEVSLCASAHTSVKETAAYWAGLYPEAKRLEDLPAERDFIEVCRALPERVQRCLEAKYRDAHAKPCLAVLRRLDTGEKNRSTRSSSNEGRRFATPGTRWHASHRERCMASGARDVRRRAALSYRAAADGVIMSPRK